MTNFKAIVSQGHIPTFDPQGKLTADQKRDIFDLSIEHLRKWNPDAYIALTGHGVIEPSRRIIDLCDFFYWEPLRPMMKNGYVKGMPAQFKFVSKGIQNAVDKGFKYVLKTRTDCVIGEPDICQYCLNILNKENTEMLLTQQTGWGDYKMGDCFMFGESDMMLDIWHEDNPVYVSNWGDGLTNTGMHFVRHFTGTKPPLFDRNQKLYDGLTWEGLLKKHTSFRDVITLKFMCLRRGYHALFKRNWGKIKKEIMDNTFDFNSFHWGKVPGWHAFDADGNMTKSTRPYYFSEKSFY